MKVRDYVRTDTGNIGKITKIIGEEKNIKDCYLNFKDMVVYGTKKNVIGIQGKVIKSSPNIIDLIEVGDYVNGWKVTQITNSYVEICWGRDSDEFIEPENIKSIVTKECFERMEYKVGE